MKYTYRHKQFTAVFTDEGGYFSLTGDIDGGSGACGDEIVKIDSRFKLMNSMHLRDAKTKEPMHAEANGIYFAEQYNKTDGKKYSLETIANHLHVSIEKAKEFCQLVKNKNDEYKDRLNISRPSDAAQVKLDMFFAELRRQWQKEAAEVVRQAKELYDDYTSDDKPSDDEDEPFDFDTCDYPEKVKALSEWLECDPDDITEETDQIFRAHGREYLVVDDDEADELWEQDLDSYIDECLELPDNMKNYFDRDKFKDDAKVDGRGHSLGRYDGNEWGVEVEYNDDKFRFYIYRQ